MLWDTHLHTRYSGDSTAEPEDMVQAALDDVNLRNNPREADAEQMSELITRMYVGEEK